MKGTIVNAWQDATHAYLAVAVAEDETDEGGQPVKANVEYIGRVPLADLENLSDADRKTALLAAVKAVRDAQQGSMPIAGLKGQVTL